jgi:mannitol operon repressor
MTEEDKKYAFAMRHTKPLNETYPHLKGFVEFLEDFNKETDRGAALAAAAYIDHLLERTLSSFFIPNHSSFGLTSDAHAPLSTFSARSAACHAMGLISEAEFQECELIRKVRNEFAHAVKMSFKDDRVKGLCSSLTMSAKPYENAAVDARGQFTTAAVSLILNFANRPHYVSERALKYQDWPQ